MLRLNFFIYFAIITNATIEATASDTGIAVHTPSSSIMGGNIISNGIKKSICRDNDRKMLILALPIHWKKLVITIWQPTIGNANM